MGDGYGKLLILLLGIGMILLALTPKGRQIIQVLVSGTAPVAAPNQTIPQSNPTDLGGYDKAGSGRGGVGA